MDPEERANAMSGQDDTEEFLPGPQDSPAEADDTDEEFDDADDDLEDDEEDEAGDTDDL